MLKGDLCQGTTGKGQSTLDDPTTTAQVGRRTRLGILSIFMGRLILLFLLSLYHNNSNTNIFGNQDNTIKWVEQPRMRAKQWHRLRRFLNVRRPITKNLELVFGCEVRDRRTVLSTKPSMIVVVACLGFRAAMLTDDESGFWKF